MKAGKGMINLLTSAAIVIAGLAVAVGIVHSPHPEITVTTTMTFTSSVTDTPQLYELTFQQTQTSCGGPVFPWAVTLWNAQIGNLTLTSPPDATIVPEQFNTGHAPLNGSTSIIFTVPSGDYSYKVNSGWGQTYGVTTVVSSDWTVQVTIPVSCGL